MAHEGVLEEQNHEQNDPVASSAVHVWSTSKLPTTCTADLSERDNKEIPVVKVKEEEEETNGLSIFFLAFVDCNQYKNKNEDGPLDPERAPSLAPILLPYSLPSPFRLSRSILVPFSALSLFLFSFFFSYFGDNSQHPTYDTPMLPFRVSTYFSFWSLYFV